MDERPSTRGRHRRARRIAIAAVLAATALALGALGGRAWLQEHRRARRST